jgi:NADPH:quinone reductase-like Zn-dependent oxidoreductase
MAVVRACAPPAAVATSSAAPSATKRNKSRVLVLGGAGRVGGSTATALSKLRPDLSILVGDMNR